MDDDEEKDKVNKIDGSTKIKLIEGIHFYYEHGYIVFTKLYHELRGYCCGNGCRHCPYK